MNQDELWDTPQSIIEKGGPDRATMLELRALFLANTERDETAPAPTNQPEREPT